MAGSSSTKETRKRAPRLGRGLSSLMAAPVAVQPPAAPPGAAEPGRKPAADASGKGGDGQAGTPLSSKPPAAGPAADSLDIAPETAPAAGILHLPVDQITPNRAQPRQRFDPATLQSLADSITADGLMQPIIVRPLPAADADGHAYELVAGERRWRAAQLAGLDTLPAVVRDLDDRQLAEWALIENVQREDLNAIDKAHAIAQLLERYELSHQEVGQRLGLDRSYISNLLRLRQLEPSTQALVADGLLTMGQARAIAGLSDAIAQAELGKRAVREGLPVRRVEAIVRDINKSSGSQGRPSRAATKANHFADLERQISEALGTRVAIKPGRKKGAGALTLEFYSLDQFDHLLDRLGVKLD